MSAANMDESKDDGKATTNAPPQLPPVVKPLQRLNVPDGLRQFPPRSVHVGKQLSETAVGSVYEGRAKTGPNNTDDQGRRPGFGFGLVRMFTASAPAQKSRWPPRWLGSSG